MLPYLCTWNDRYSYGNVIAHGKYPVIIDTEFMFDRRIEVGTQGKNLQQNLWIQ